ncbi:Hypothetical predicted protein, partial [Paramuricea clavata]
TKICDDLYKSGKTITGVYTIDPDGLGAFTVPCDMETTPGRGWTIFQRRIDGSENFNRTWAEYKSGFGNLSGEFWLGLDKIHRLSANGQNWLRIDLDTFENGAAYALYESFSVGNERDAYVLNIGNYSGTARNSFKYHNGMKFSTLDVENHKSQKTNCGKAWKGGWWFNSCSNAYLNGKYQEPEKKFGKPGIYWKGLVSPDGKDVLKGSEMKLGPAKV